MKAVVGLFKAGAPWSIIIALLVLVLGAVPVAAVLGLLSVGLDQVYMNGRLIRAMGENTWEQQKNFLLIAIPMFILMGEIILRSGIAKRMYNAVAGWLTWLWLLGWLSGWLACCLAVWPSGCLAGWLVASLAACLVVWLSGCQAVQAARRGHVR